MNIKKKISIILLLTLIINCSNPVEEKIAGSGEIEGYKKEYYESGNIKHEGQEVDGLYEGIHTWYYSNGKKEIVANYSKGFLDGYYEDYFDNGNVKSKGNLIRDHKDGKWEYFNKNGILTSIEIIDYKDKSKFLHTTNYLEGEIIKEELYFKDDYLFYAEIYDDMGTFVNVGISPLTIDNNGNNDTIKVNGIDSIKLYIPAFYGLSKPIKIRFHKFSKEDRFERVMNTEFRDFKVPKNGIVSLSSNVVTKGTYYLHGVYFWEFNKTIKGGTPFQKVLIYE